MKVLPHLRCVVAAMVCALLCAPPVFPQQQAYIGGSPEDWDLNAIRDALEDLSPELIPDLDGFIDLLYDYADDGYTPRNVDGLSFKPVPMINEVVISNTVQLLSAFEADELIWRVHVAIETWFPFPGSGNRPFTLSVPYELAPIQVFPLAYTPLTNLLILETMPSPVTITPPHEAHDFRVTRFTYVSSMPVNCFDPAQCPPAPSAMGLRLQIPDSLEVWLHDPVDRVLPEWPANAWVWTIGPVAFPPLVRDGPPVPIGHPKALSVNDPRLNGDPSAGGQWFHATATLGQTNINVSGPEGAEVGVMYSAQRPFQSVTELTNLLYRADRPWDTIRLTGPDTNQTVRIIDRLTVLKNSLGTPYSWLIEQGYTNDIDTAEHEIGLNEVPLWQSFLAGLIPNDPASRFVIHDLTQEGNVGFDTVTGRLYSVHSTVDLRQPAWQTMTNDIPGTGDRILVPVVSDDPARAYRIGVRLP